MTERKRRVWRVEVAPRGDADPAGERFAGEAREAGVRVDRVGSRRVYLLETDASEAAVREAALPLLADGVAEAAELQSAVPDAADGWIEVHYKPGVMDPAAASVEEALARRGLAGVAVRTGRVFVIGPPPGRGEMDRLSALAANGVVERVHFRPHLQAAFERGDPRPFEVRRVALTALDDDGLAAVSRDGHLFLNLAEMRAIRDHYREIGRKPTDAELETLAQTWSEHCVHKTLKSSVVVRDADGRELRRYGNLIRDTIFASTKELIDRRNDGFCLSVFKDNAGVVAFDERDAVCFKVETHNRPSALEPYGGAATGIGGVIRDVLGTGLGARPVANTDVFCVAPEDAEVPPGVLPPRRVLDGIVGGVRDYGNRMGIPTVNGAIVYDPRYVANPLVFCGCVGVIPRDKVEKAAKPGDRIVVMGGRTGRDGIHGATFSSAELTDTAGSEFAHAVQIGNPITEKKLADVLLQARDRGLFTAVTDCGAGGLSSAVGEMGEETGASVELDKVPLKYAGLRYDEVWISEAQERMVLSVPPDKLNDLLTLCAAEDVEATDVGGFGQGDPPELLLRWHGTEVGRLPMAFLHDGLPMPQRQATVEERGTGFQPVIGSDDRLEACPTSLLSKLREPNVASKHRVVRQYDTEVLAGTVVKPFVGPAQLGPSDAAVVRPKLGSNQGVVIACGLAPHVADPYDMALAAIDEAVRNAVCVGARLDKLALLDNFCWPGTDSAEAMGTLVRACEACRDAALAWGTPFVSGKDSLHNQFTDRATGRTIRIPPTLLISAIGVVDDVRRCVTSDLKRPGDALWLVSPAAESPTLAERFAVHAAVADLIASGEVTAAHDVSDGGWLVAVAEMCIGGNLGVELHDADGHFDEPLTTYLLAGAGLTFPAGVRAANVGEVLSHPVLIAPDEPLCIPRDDPLPVADLRRAWRRED